MLKIKKYLLQTSLKYIFINQIITLFLVIFLNLIELSRALDSEKSNIYNFIYLSFLKIPSIINETSPFVIIISTAFLFKYLISNNELISMRNVGFSIFDVFQPIALSVFSYGLIILLFLNPIAAIFDIKYNNILDNNYNDMYSINLSENSLWIKSIKIDDGLYFINIEKFNIKEMIATNIKILSIDKKRNDFYQAKKGRINQGKFILQNVDYFNISNDDYKFIENLELELNFTRDNILSSVVNYKNVPYYNYINHIRTLKKFNLYTSSISLHYLSEILKPFFIVLLSFVVMGFSAKYRRNENFFKILFISVLLGFIFYILREIINKFTLSFDTNFIY